MYTVCVTLCVYYTLRTCYPSMLRTRAYASLHEIHWREDEAMWIGCIYQWRWSCQLCFLFGSSVSAHVRVFALVHLFLLLCVCLQVCVIKKIPRIYSHKLQQQQQRKLQQELLTISWQILSGRESLKMIENGGLTIHRKREALSEANFER